MSDILSKVKENISKIVSIDNTDMRLVANYDGKCVWYNIVGHDWHGMSDTKETIDLVERGVRDILHIDSSVNLCWASYSDYIDLLYAGQLSGSMCASLNLLSESSKAVEMADVIKINNAGIFGK